MPKRCIFPGCKTIPNFNLPGKSTATHCATHKLDGMIDIVSKRCIGYTHPTHGYYGCPTLVSSDKYDGYCLRCYMYLHPDQPVCRNYKTKEFAVVEFIKKSYPDLSWVFDRVISGGCSRKRPDICLDLGYQMLMIEVDEDMHVGYSCENKRINSLSEDIRYQPLVMLRFNPDGYQTQKEGKISSCWGTNKKGICSVKPSKRVEWNNRLETLRDQVAYWLEPRNASDGLIKIVQLFYE